MIKHNDTFIDKFIEGVNDDNIENIIRVKYHHLLADNEAKDKQKQLRLQQYQLQKQQYIAKIDEYNRKISEINKKINELEDGD